MMGRVKPLSSKVISHVPVVRLPACGMILPAPQGSWQTQEIWYLYPTAHPVKVLIAAPSCHLCEHGSWEEATGLHVVGDLLQALRVRTEREVRPGAPLG